MILIRIIMIFLFLVLPGCKTPVGSVLAENREVQLKECSTAVRQPKAGSKDSRVVAACFGKISSKDGLTLFITKENDDQMLKLFFNFTRSHLKANLQQEASFNKAISEDLNHSIKGRKFSLSIKRVEGANFEFMLKELVSAANATDYLIADTKVENFRSVDSTDDFDVFINSLKTR
jgi:hypothetical protein